MTDYIRAALEIWKPYHPIFKKLDNFLAVNKQTQIIDLCSGSGGPILAFTAQTNSRVRQVFLSDKFPPSNSINYLTHTKDPPQKKSARYFRAKRESPFKSIISEKNDILANKTALQSSVSYLPQPVDILRYQPSSMLTSDISFNIPFGTRTMFTALHHFSAPQVYRLFRNIALKDRMPLASFEVTSKHPISFLMIAITPVLVFFLTPLLLWRYKERRISRFILTYCLPVVPLFVTLDGLISCMNSHSNNSLKKLTSRIPEYDWTIGVERGAWLLPIQYIFGSPRQV